MSQSHEPLRPPLHQPPNPEDLRRAPPRTPECARVRGLLRDFVDHDLDHVLAGEVEEHVHQCRACAVELARSEHEVLRLRDAFARTALAKGATPPTLPVDFAARVVERLVLDETSLVSRDALAKAVSMAGGVRREAGVATTGVATTGVASAGAGATGAGSMRDAGLRPAMAFFGALVCLLLLVLAMARFGDAAAAPNGVPRFVVVAADAAYGGNRWLRLGDGLGEGQSLRVGRGGGARVLWHDPSTKTQPAATLRVHGEGELHMVQGRPLLTSGAVDFETNRPVSIPMADGSQLDLGIGAYTISAGLRPGDDPLAALPVDLLIEVEVKAGDPATIVRPGFASTMVASGFMGIYQGASDTAVMPTGSGAVGAAMPETREPAEVPAANAPLLIGSVREWNGLPSVGANLGLAFGAGPATGTMSGADGRFQVELKGASAADFVVALGIASAVRSDLGFIAPDAVRLVSQGSNRVMASPLVFDLSAPCFGSVRDDAGLPRGGVEVVPCLVDDLFGTVFPILHERVVTNSYGVFRCDRLPARLPVHQSLYLLCVHDELDAGVIAVPPRGSALAQFTLPPLVLPRLRTVQITDLEPHAVVSVLEELPGLPVGSGARRRIVTADALGRIEDLEVGWSPMWVGQMNDGDTRLRQLTVAAVAGGTTYRPSEPSSAELATVFRELDPIQGTAIEVVRSFRHQKFAALPTSVGVTQQTLGVQDVVGRGLVAQVFAVSGTGPRGTANVRFLGFTSSIGRLVAGLSSTDDGLVALTDDGSVGMASFNAAVTGVITMTAVGTGRAMLPAALRPAANAGALIELRFRRVDTSLPGLAPKTVRRVGNVTGWEAGDLVPGEYRVGIGSAEYLVTVPSGGFGIIHP